MPSSNTPQLGLRIRPQREGKVVKRIIIRCMKTKATFSNVVPYKGVGKDQFVCGLVAADIAWLGHNQLVLKADNEPALQALVEQSLQRARLECKDIQTITTEQSAAYDSQSNGGVEAGR